MPVHDFMEHASALLLAAADVLDTVEPGAPGRQVVTIGPPPLDCCDQLAVSAIEMRDARVGPQDEAGLLRKCMSMNLVALRVTITGCVPTVDERGNPPTPAAINNASTTLYGQGWTLWCGLYTRLVAGTVFDDDLEPRESFIGPLLPLPEQGGCAGFTVDVVARLDRDRGLGAEGS